ncbi:tRNA (adenosine(37)-N6)-threonylcarbamoyltransferase complex dimerization subunit type 1 TsaB [Demequina aurantiaca]|uniref:tRNA (adenosine(37)-N6)-threonylcarbamoyltransferase complex dimerization subunit type 1 TsaB n=1 Tax=Demequina aurantiaca TaxID=676200 RepID=UPI003D34D0B8
MILAIDTSSAISVAVVDGDHTLAERSQFAPRGHAELLSGMIEEVLLEAGIRERGPDSIVVGTGPAPFTGLRVGLVTARTLAMVWGVSVRGVCSLDAMGAQAADAGHSAVTVVGDARRKEVYWATYTDGMADGEPRVSAPGDVSPVGAVVGRGAQLYPDAFPSATSADPDPAWLARVVSRRLANGEESFPTEPMYMRRPDVHGIPGA